MIGCNGYEDEPRGDSRVAIRRWRRWGMLRWMDGGGDGMVCFVGGRFSACKISLGGGSWSL